MLFPLIGNENVYFDSTGSVLSPLMILFSLIGNGNLYCELTSSVLRPLIMLFPLVRRFQDRCVHYFRRLLTGLCTLN